MGLLEQAGRLQIDFKDCKHNEEVIDGAEPLLKGTSASAVLVLQVAALLEILRSHIVTLLT